MLSPTGRHLIIGFPAPELNWASERPAPGDPFLESLVLLFRVPPLGVFPALEQLVNSPPSLGIIHHIVDRLPAHSEDTKDRPLDRDLKKQFGPRVIERAPGFGEPGDKLLNISHALHPRPRFHDICPLPLIVRTDFEVLQPIFYCSRELSADDESAPTAIPPAFIVVANRALGHRLIPPPLGAQDAAKGEYKVIRVVLVRSQTQPWRPLK